MPLYNIYIYICIERERDVRSAERPARTTAGAVVEAVACASAAEQLFCVLPSNDSSNNDNDNSNDDDNDNNDIVKQYVCKYIYIYIYTHTHIICNII